MGHFRDISCLTATVLFTFITTKIMTDMFSQNSPTVFYRGPTGLAQHEDKNLLLSELSFLKENEFCTIFQGTIARLLWFS